MKDPEFVDIANKQNLDLDPRTGERAEEFLRKAYASSPAVIEVARKLLNE